MENNEVNEFWENLEKEINEKIEIYTLAEYKQGDLNIQTPNVGLLYLTSTVLYFHTFPKTNWINQIVSNFNKSKQDKEAIVCKVLLKDIKKAEIVKYSWWEKLFSIQMPLLRIIYNDDEVEKIVLIAVHSKDKEIIRHLGDIEKQSEDK